ncbi:hypothetical protein NC653_001458 [Populus alba x Populus x berolinensis]|uniref:Uncharacterized protein n=1 Tax=Populus alba x Populus x berolinensis TaxID=444605 RepID=A0AAD6WFJ4_9ROSI|nr:hypothetical protein NC653_001458 [Populus alba x Populus x berolinensis]
MDVSDDEMEKEIETPENGKKGFIYLAFRLTLALLFPIFAFLSLSILLGFLAIFMGHLSITTPLSLPSQCKILSSSVDLRSSKVCEPGFLNYKAKHVFYPYNRSKFRCRYDYYWASVFEVEYKDYSLGQTQFALAEAPNEALPLNCRPNFGAAWLTKDKFKVGIVKLPVSLIVLHFTSNFLKSIILLFSTHSLQVNKTYDCWYTSGILKVSLYRDDLFSCQAKDPSQVEMIKRFFILSKEMLHSLMVQKKGKAGYWRCIAGVIAGFSTSIIAISFIIILQHIKSWFRLPSVARMFSHTNIVFFKRTCFLVAYISFMGWLTIQYGKRLGLPEIRRVYNY